MTRSHDVNVGNIISPPSGEEVEVRLQNLSPSLPRGDSRLDDAVNDNDHADVESAAVPKRKKTNIKKACLTIVAVVLGASAAAAAFYGVKNALSQPHGGSVQQQMSESVANVFGEKGKGRKEPKLPLECDQTFENGEHVTLDQDLVCKDPTSTSKCAITLKGSAKLDCKKFTINNEGSWKRGICVEGGATVKNCVVQEFGSGGRGIYIRNGGKVEDSEVRFNDGYGIYAEVDDQAGSTTTTKISNTYVHDNGSYGIYVDEMETATSEHLIQIKGVRSNNNKYDGMFFDLEAGADTTVILKDSETSNNEWGGISIEAYNGEKKVDLQGSIGVHDNARNGMYLSLYEGDNVNVLDVTVKGVVNIVKNGWVGLLVYMDPTENDVLDVIVKGVVNILKNGRDGLDFTRANAVVEKGGYLNSCDNNVENKGSYFDIKNSQGATFSGGTYTCGTKKANAGDYLPTCDDCQWN